MYYFALYHFLAFQHLQVFDNCFVTLFPPLAEERNGGNYLPAFQCEQVAVVQHFLVIPICHEQQVKPPFQALRIGPQPVIDDFPVYLNPTALHCR